MAISFDNQILSDVADPVSAQDVATKNWTEINFATAAQGALADTALQAVVDDVAPQLGGDLDINGFSIVSTSNANINIVPDGTGQVVLGNSGDATISSDQNFDFTVKSGDSDGSADAGSVSIIGGNGSGAFASGDIVITSGTGGASDGVVIINGLTWPTADGTVGQFLSTDGAGNLSFATVLINIVEDTTPQLGGDLDANTFGINNMADPVNDQDAATKAYVDNNTINSTTTNESALLTLTDAANISWDADLGTVAEVTLTDDRILDNPTNLQPGGRYDLIIRQDATGGRDLTFGSAFKWVNGDEPNFGSAAPNAVDLIKAVSDGTNLYCEVLRNFG